MGFGNFELATNTPVNSQEKIKPITDDEILDLQNNLYDELGEINPDTQSEQHEKIVNSFKNKLLEQSARFDRIFETQKGSIYFSTAEGHTIRVHDKSSGEYKLIPVEPLTANTFFISEKEFERIMNLTEDRKSINNLVGQSIETTEYGVGAKPVELGIVNMSDHQKVEYSGNTAKITGYGIQDIHLGHAIKRVIK
jgi:hypothetical protein